MIALDEKNNVYISQGDTLTLKFVLSEPLGLGDVATLSIRQKNKIPALVASIEGSGVQELEFVIPAEDMEKLPVGRYLYDLKFDYASGERYTADWARELHITSTAHEV